MRRLVVEPCSLSLPRTLIKNSLFVDDADAQDVQYGTREQEESSSEDEKFIKEE